MGGLLLIVGLAVLGFGLMQHFKGKRILAAPFKKTGELAKNPVSEDPKGAMSTEGKVVPPETPLLSPCTQQPCLSYELKIERLYEKTETTQDGTKTVKGTETLDTIKGGAVFGLDDGSGAIAIDVSKGADFDNYKEGFKKEINGHSGSSHIQFGELTYDVPAIGSDKGWTIGFKATEKFVPVEGSLFVLGKLEGAKLTKPGWRSMMTSAKGREGLLGSIQKKKKFSFIGGGVAAVLSIPLMIFGPKADPNAVSAYCESNLKDARQRCSDTVSSVDGEKYTWTVTKPGQYELTVFAPAKKISFLPQLIVTDAAGEELINETGGVGTNAVSTVDVKAGTYSVVVRPGDSYMVKGGFSFDLQIKSLTPEPVAAPKTAKAGQAAAEEPDDGEADLTVGKGGYTAEDLSNRVDELNELCPDTFCEGEFNYEFKSLVCDAPKSCVLSFTANKHESKKAFDAQVVIAGFTELRPDYEKEFVYEGSFDEKVSNALMKWESNPRSVKAAPVAKATPAPAPKPAPVVAKVEPKPEPKPAPAPVIAKPAPKPATVAVAPVAKPAPVVKARATVAAPAPAPSMNRTSKNLED